MKRMSIHILYRVAVMAIAAGCMFLCACSGKQRHGSDDNVAELASGHHQPYKVMDYPTPNKTEGVNTVEGIVLHHTAIDSIGEALDILTNPSKGVSCHVLIDRDGTRYVMAKPDEITWHAGLSALGGKEKANNFTVGIEFQGNTLEAPLTDDQINSGIEYMLPIMEEYGIPLDKVVTHGQIRQEYKQRHPKSKALDKHDITEAEYERFMSILRQRAVSEPD